MILSGGINESKQQKKPLYVAALDVQKAFDVVDHNSLLWKLYLDGISGDDWLLMKDLYTSMSAKVKWDGFLSSQFVIRQGLRQGNILSASLYKRYNNSFLIDVEDRKANRNSENSPCLRSWWYVFYHGSRSGAPTYDVICWTSSKRRTLYYASNQDSNVEVQCSTSAFCIPIWQACTDCRPDGSSWYLQTHKM